MICSQVWQRSQDHRLVLTRSERDLDANFCVIPLSHCRPDTLFEKPQQISPHYPRRVRMGDLEEIVHPYWIFYCFNFSLRQADANARARSPSSRTFLGTRGLPRVPSPLRSCASGPMERQNSLWGQDGEKKFTVARFTSQPSPGKESKRARSITVNCSLRKGTKKRPSKSPPTAE